MNLRYDSQSLAEYVIVVNVLNIKRAKYIKIWLVQNMYSIYRYICLPSLKLTVRTWKWLVSRWFLAFFGSLCLCSRLFFAVRYRDSKLHHPSDLFFCQAKNNFSKWCFFLLGWKHAPVIFSIYAAIYCWQQVYTLLGTNMSPEKESLEEYVPFEMAAVWGDMFVFGSVVLLCSFVQLVIFQLAMSTWAQSLGYGSQVLDSKECT